MVIILRELLDTFPQTTYDSLILFKYILYFLQVVKNDLMDKGKIFTIDINNY